jgi:hypothetical protein
LPKLRSRRPSSSRQGSSRSRSKPSLSDRLSWINRSYKSFTDPIYAIIFDKPVTHHSSKLSYLSLLFSASFFSLAALFSISILFSLFPLSLTRLDWYLRFFASFAESAPLLIASFSFGIASVLIHDSSRARAKLLILLRRLSRTFVIGVLLLLPIQLAFGVRFANRNFNINRSEIVRISSQSRDLQSTISEVSSKDQLQTLLQQRGLGVDVQRLNLMELDEAKAQASSVLIEQTDKRIIELNLLRQRRLITDLVDGTKLILSWLAIFFYFAFLQRVTKRLSIRTIDQSSHPSP